MGEWQGRCTPITDHTQQGHHQGDQGDGTAGQEAEGFAPVVIQRWLRVGAQGCNGDQARTVGILIGFRNGLARGWSRRC
jgi:hypothetical protein